MTEIWRDVVGYVGSYQVSDLGRVRSLERVVMMKNGISKTVIGRILRHSPDDLGRIRVFLSNQEGVKTIRVHRLVLEAFVGPCPEGMEGCHNDGDHTNNQPSNLRWDTHYNNVQDMVKHGTSGKGAKNAMAVLSSTQVAKIRSMAGTMRQRDIGALYGVSQTCISKIQRGDRWVAPSTESRP